MSPLRYLEVDRSKVYGDPEESHRSIGMAWAAILRNWLGEEFPLIPAWVVALMLATFKNVRAARPTFHKDSYDDAHVYLSFSERFRTTPGEGPGSGQDVETAASGRALR